MTRRESIAAQVFAACVAERRGILDDFSGTLLAQRAVMAADMLEAALEKHVEPHTAGVLFEAAMEAAWSDLADYAKALRPGERALFHRLIQRLQDLAEEDEARRAAEAFDRQAERDAYLKTPEAERKFRDACAFVEKLGHGPTGEASLKAANDYALARQTRGGR